jgi:hypothetical protein
MGHPLLMIQSRFKKLRLRHPPYMVYRITLMMYHGESGGKPSLHP